MKDQFLKGFSERAKEYGIDGEAHDDLVKLADDRMEQLKNYVMQDIPDTATSPLTYPGMMASSIMPVLGPAAYTMAKTRDPRAALRAGLEPATAAVGGILGGGAAGALGGATAGASLGALVAGVAAVLASERKRRKWMGRIAPLIGGGAAVGGSIGGTIGSSVGGAYMGAKGLQKVMNEINLAERAKKAPPATTDESHSL